MRRAREEEELRKWKQMPRFDLCPPNSSHARSRNINTQRSHKVHTLRIDPVGRVFFYLRGKIIYTVVE